MVTAHFLKVNKELYAEIPENDGWQGSEVRELRERKWEKELEALLKKEKKTRQDIEAAPKSVRWKVDIAKVMKRTTTTTNPWFAKTLAMDHPSRVCNLVNEI